MKISKQLVVQFLNRNQIQTDSNKLMRYLLGVRLEKIFFMVMLCCTGVLIIVGSLSLLHNLPEPTASVCMGAAFFLALTIGVASMLLDALINLTLKKDQHWDDVRYTAKRLAAAHKALVRAFGREIISPSGSINQDYYNSQLVRKASEANKIPDWMDCTARNELRSMIDATQAFVNINPDTEYRRAFASNKA